MLVIASTGALSFVAFSLVMMKLLRRMRSGRASGAGPKGIAVVVKKKE